MKKLNFVSIILIVVFSVLSVSAQPPGGVVIVGEGEESLRSIIEFLLFYGPPGQETIVTVGEIPESAPFDLRLPDGVTLVGSVDRGMGFGGIEVWMLSEDSIEATSAAFSDLLTADGWTIPEGIFGMQPGGFVPVVSIDTGYCQDQQFITISTQKRDDDQTAVILRYDDFNTPSFCLEQDAPEDPYNAPYMLIPALTLPDGVGIRQETRGGRGGGGGGYGPMSAETSVALVSELPANEIAASYNSQLEAAGWDLIDSNSGDVAGWSSWTFHDDKDQLWSGIFTLTKLPATENAYFAFIHIEQAPEK